MNREERHQRVTELFTAALELPPAARRAFLERECAGDEELLSEVVELLEKDADPSGPLSPLTPLEEWSGDETPSSQLIQKLASHKPKELRYRFVGEIARGGMGAILRVWDDDLGRQLAMKIMLGQAEALSRGHTPPVEARKLTRFLEEAQITGQLDHPGIVPVHELGIDDQGRVFFTMRLVKGDDLKRILELLQEGQAGWNRTRVLGILLRVCEAMAFAHARGVVHRDLKPGNLMVGRFGEVYVMDWGLARSLDQLDSKDIRLAGEPEPPTAVHTYRDKPASDAPLVTRDGDVVGTPAYMSPEQARGELELIGKRSDVYSVGAILYEVLTGERPYAAPTASPHATWHRVLEGPPAPVEQLAHDVPGELVAICEKAMARDPRERYDDMLEMANDLRAFLEHRVVRAYRTGALAELRKWVVRNRAVAAMVAALLLVVTTSGFAIARIDALRAREERRALLERSAPAYLARADELFPIHPDQAPAMRNWLEGARELVAQRPRLEAELARLRARALGEAPRGTARSSEQEDEAVQLEFLAGILEEQLDLARDRLATGASPDARDDERNVEVLSTEVPALRSRAQDLREEAAIVPSPRFSSVDDQQRYERLRNVLDVLRRLDGGTGALASVEERLAEAETLEQDTIEEHHVAWDAAIRSISSPLECPAYGGSTLSPQVGLVPLRRDPASGLWEFWHVLSGERPEPLPEGGYSLRPESGIVLVLVPAGTFLLGAQRDDLSAPGYDPAAQPSEGPPRSVGVDAFFLGRYEMTQGQFRRLTGYDPSERFAGLSARGNPRVSRTHPVEHVSWQGAIRALARWSLELPTEAQWEYAARGGTTLPYGSSASFEDLLGKVNWKDRAALALSNLESPEPPIFDDDDGYSIHAPVGAFPANPFGLQQMLGNVAEWTRDAYCTDYGTSVREIVEGTGELRPWFSNARTVRGGHYESEPSDLRVSRRIKHMATYSDRTVGVRPCRRVE